MTLNGLDKEELKTLLKEVFAEAAHPLSDDEIKWVRLAIEAEAKKAAFRQAVIDKTLIGLLSSGVIGLVYFCIDAFKNHWK
jgi:F0F1-type ATP synthase delta subunit